MLATVTLAALVTQPWRQVRNAERLPEAPAYFTDFLDGQEHSALRGASLSDAPRPVAPRWSALRRARPVFRWYAGGGLPGEHRGEILVVDDTERVVATLPYDFAAVDPSVSLELAWSADQAPLEPDRNYAWKVNAVAAGGWVASEYVPFRVLDTEAVGVHLARVDGNVFRTGVEMAALGLYDEALATFAGLGRRDDAVLERFATAILARKRLTGELAEMELKRWSTSRAAAD